MRAHNEKPVVRGIKTFSTRPETPENYSGDGVGVSAFHLFYTGLADCTDPESFRAAQHKKMIKNEQRGQIIRHATALRALSALIIFSFAFSSCQRESEEITPVKPKDVISPSSAVAKYIERVTLNDGSPDNIIDNASCISLVLPVTVIVNGEQIRIDSASDFILVEKILDRSVSDHDSVIVIFPVNAILPDHSHQILNSQEELDALAQSCKEGGGDDDIECIDFEYPVTLSVYDSLNQTFRTVTLEDDADLFEFFSHLKESDLATFRFPIKVVLNDGQEITISNNDQLEEAIVNAMQGCDEDDDNDHNDDDADTGLCTSVLLGSNWHIISFVHEVDQTDAFADFVFTFHADSTVSATDGSSAITGTWETDGDDGTIELDLHFTEESPFDDLSESWKLTEFSNTLIKLKHVSEEEAYEDVLVFEKK